MSLLLTGPATLSAGVNSVLLILRTFGRLDPPTPFVLGFPIPFREKKKQLRQVQLCDTYVEAIVRDFSTYEPDFNTYEPDLSTYEPDFCTYEPDFSTYEPD